MLHRIIVIMLILIFISEYGFTQADYPGIMLDTWYKTQPGAGTYNSIKESLLGLFIQSTACNIPLHLLVERLSEGVSKHIPPVKLYSAIEDEVRRLSLIIEMIQNIDRVSKAERKIFFFNIIENGVVSLKKGDNVLSGDEWLRQLSIINRGGLLIQSMSGLFLFALKENKTADSVLLLLHSFLKIPGFSGFAESDINSLGQSLISSSLSPSSYSTLSSIFLKGRVVHLSNEVIRDIIIDILKQGGGLVRIEQEIARRGKKK